MVSSVHFSETLVRILGTMSMAEHDIVIREVRDTDYEHLRTFLEDNNIPETTRHFRPFPLSKGTAHWIACTEHLDKYYVATKGGCIVGLCMLRGWDEGYEIPSFGVLVDRRWQGLSLGQRMAEFSIARAQETGCPAVRLSVYASNRRARQLYESLGFVEISREPANVDGEEDAKIVMSKELKA